LEEKIVIKKRKWEIDKNLKKKKGYFRLNKIDV
jgi:hypothetical protein